MRVMLIRTLFICFLTLAGTSFTEAASLYIDPPRSELNRGDAIELSVRLDVDEQSRECVNAIDAVITYSDNIEPVDISIGDSIFSIWVEQPVINKNERTISFAGGMPNGYCGRVVGDPRLTNNLVKLIFRSPGLVIGSASDDPQARVEFTEQTTAYLNDGFGTAVVPRTFGASMTLSKSPGTSVLDPWSATVNADTIPPEEFTILLRKGGLEFSGKYYISFNTTDKQTGIDIYQVMEEPLEEFGTFSWGRADAPWVTARSPYVLKDQSLNSTIRVRAIDKAGNEYVATLLPDESLRGASRNQLITYAVVGLGILVVLGCLGVIIGFYRQWIKKKKSHTDESTSDNDAEPTETVADDEEEIPEHEN